MSDIIIIHKNILETGTVTVTSEATGYDAWRLHDRRLGKPWKATSTASQTININQGPIAASGFAVGGHNLLNAQIAIYYSTPSTGTTLFYQGVVTTAGIIHVTMDTQLGLFWEMVLSSLINVPEVGELFIGPAIQLAATPVYGLRRGLQKNVERVESPGGIVHQFKKGEPRRQLSLSLPRISTVERQSLEELEVTCAEGKCFFMADHEGEGMFCELVDSLVFTESGNGVFSTDMDVLEVL